jgi:hypothetical protein
MHDPFHPRLSVEVLEKALMLALGSAPERLDGSTKYSAVLTLVHLAIFHTAQR